MHPKVVVYTATFGGYDVLRAPAVRDKGVEYICFTDVEPPLAEGWSVRIVEPPPVTPYAQREYKILSHQTIPEADITLYHDGNFQLLASPLDLIERYLQNSDIALFSHPQRNSVYDEIAACAKLNKDSERLLTLLASRYRSLGVPEEGHLFAGGVILRRHTHSIAEFNEAWMTELRRSSPRDQPALAFTLWSKGIEPARINENIWKNDLIRFHPHKARHVRPNRNFLFICGNPRSGTSAVCNLLNVDRRIIVGMERYRRIRESLTPAHFTRERFFDPNPGHTNYLPLRLIPPNQPGFNVWPEDEEEVIAKWDSANLEYVGDKAPFYVRQLPYMREVFPGAKFVILLRDPVGVASSYQKRAMDPNDHWPKENDFSLGVEHWNQTVDDILRDVRRHGLGEVFIVDYEDFFSGDATYLRSLYHFLELDLPDNVEEAYRAITEGWNDRVGESTVLSEPQVQSIRDTANWDGYDLLSQTVPIMRHHDLLGGASSAAEAKARRQALMVAYQELFDLSRVQNWNLLQRYSDEIVDGLSARTDVAKRADVAWQTFWKGFPSLAIDLLTEPTNTVETEEGIQGEVDAPVNGLAKVGGSAGGSDVELAARLADTQEILDRLRSRRIVRLALRASRLARPLFRWSRRAGRRES